MTHVFISLHRLGREGDRASSRFVFGMSIDGGVPAEEVSDPSVSLNLLNTLVIVLVFLLPR